MRTIAKVIIDYCSDSSIALTTTGGACSRSLASKGARRQYQPIQVINAINCNSKSAAVPPALPPPANPQLGSAPPPPDPQPTQTAARAAAPAAASAAAVEEDAAGSDRTPQQQRRPRQVLQPPAAQQQPQQQPMHRAPPPQMHNPYAAPQQHQYGQSQPQHSEFITRTAFSIFYDIWCRGSSAAIPFPIYSNHLAGYGSPGMGGPGGGMAGLPGGGLPPLSAAEQIVYDNKLRALSPYIEHLRYEWLMKWLDSAVATCTNNFN